jgi:hypothetical protein
MKLNIKYWANFQKWLRIISGFFIFCVFLVIYIDSGIILKNKYQETNNNLYIFLLFMLMIFYWHYS